MYSAIFAWVCHSVLGMEVIPMRMTEHWNGLPGALVESPSLEIIQKPSGCGPGQPAIGGPALIRESPDGLQKSLPSVTIL